MTSLMKKGLMIFQYLHIAYRACLLRRESGDSVTLYGFYGASDKASDRNIGDNAILRSMLEALDGIAVDKLIGVIDCEGTYDRFGTEFCARPGITDLSTWLPIIKKTKLFLLGGGGLFQDYGKSKWVPFSLFLLSFLFWVAGRKIMWYSIGVGPLVTKAGRIFTRLAAQLADGITVRDSESKQLLTDIGVKEASVYVTADPAVAMRFRPKENSSRKGKIVGLSLSPFYETVFDDEKKNTDLRVVFVDFIQFLLDAGYAVRLFAFRSGPDIQLYEQIVADVNNPGVKIVERSFNEEEILKEYTDLDYFVGMRFHSIIFSMLASVPVGIIIYHPKVRSLVNSAKLEEYSVELNNLTLSNMKYMFSRLERDDFLVKGKMETWIETQRVRLIENVKMVERLLYNGD